MNAPDSIFACAEKLMKNCGEQAKDTLTERLIAGKRVGKFDLSDILDCELNSERYRVLKDELAALLLHSGEACEVKGAVEKIRDGLIERFLSEHEDLVREEAEEQA